MYTVCFFSNLFQLVGSHPLLDFPYASSDLEEANLRIARYLWVEAYVVCICESFA